MVHGLPAVNSCKSGFAAAAQWPIIASNELKSILHSEVSLETDIARAILLAFACTSLAAFSNLAQAQKLDVGFGVSTITAPSASFSDGFETAPSLSGGAYPGFSFDGIFWHHLGIGTEIFWRASQSDNYLGSGFNYRPLYYAFNAVYSPKLAKHTYLELVAGMGAMSTRFYSGTVCGPYSCSNYQSFNHFMEASARASSFMSKAVSSSAPRRGFI